MMKQLTILFCCLLSLASNAQDHSVVNLFRLQDVELLPGVFKEAQNTDTRYVMAMDPDRLLSPYLREAGLKPKAPSYTNWENTGLDGHICGHYLSALSMMYASTGDTTVFKRLNYMIDELQKCQEQTGTGYLGGVPDSKSLWDSIAKGEFEAGSFNVNKSWVPLYNIHKMYAGLYDAYQHAGIDRAKDMLIGFTDWMIGVTANLSDEQIQALLQSEHGGLNHVFAEVAAITGDKKYLNLAKRFCHQSILLPLTEKKDELDYKHANTQIPKVIGFERIATLTGDEKYHTASLFFWDNVVNHRSVAIGGNSVREHFHPVDDFSSMTTSEQGPETCNTYNMLKLTKMLYCADPNEKYINYYERALYNHILSSQHPGKGGFVYFTSMRPGHYRVYSQPHTSMWCCVGSGMENHAKYGELIYAYSGNRLFVNLFIPSRLNWKEKGITISQHTTFPEEGKTVLYIEKTETPSFSLQLRYPHWVTPGAMQVAINGNALKITANPGDYFSVNRNWSVGDRIVITLPMQINIEHLPDSSDYVAVNYGPVVLVAKTDTADLKGLFADDSRMGHVASGRLLPLHEMPVFVSSTSHVQSKIKAVNGKPITFSAQELIYPNKYKTLELMPFYKVHDSRYIIYWQLVTPEKLEQMQQQMAQEEAKRQKRNEQTLDVVYAGEQQPESDHFVKSEQSITGVSNGRHWRSAKGWFSYILNNKDQLAAVLQVTYLKAGKGKSFVITVNNTIVAEVTLDGDEVGFISADYSLPEAVLREAKDQLLVKFIAADGSETGRICEVRLLKKE